MGRPSSSKASKRAKAIIVEDEPEFVDSNDSKSEEEQEEEIQFNDTESEEDDGHRNPPFPATPSAITLRRIFGSPPFASIRHQKLCVNDEETSSGSKRFHDEFASEDQCAKNLLMLSILTFLTTRPRAPSGAAAPPLLNDEVYVGGRGSAMDMVRARHCVLSTPFEG
ncbi:hypothetical protein PIB30_009405 [Stylosanthes scabra]|uniref:Uncharacterized protein n=1 Tax=Stylosanthes scabra TaxID=79078 RepID=A0ABU6W360_9FABA|nr:hypothetical protein [Stylosanthes scabra]